MGLDISRIKMGYILAYKGDGGFFSNQIVKQQKNRGLPEFDSQVTHIEVSGGCEHSVNISPPFSKLINITKRHAGRYVFVLRYKNKDYDKKGRYKVAYFSATLCNMGYDIAGVLRFLFKWIKQFNRLFFCSEGATWALQMEYPDVFGGREPYEIMPADFMNREFEITQEGYVPDNREPIRQVLWKNLIRTKAVFRMA